MQALHRACADGNAAEAERLLRSDGDQINTRSWEGLTPLHWACNHKDFAELALLLLKWGADPNKQNNFGSTALHYACYGGHLKCAKALLWDGRADQRIEDYDGRTARVDAVERNFVHLTNLLDAHAVAAILPRSQISVLALGVLHVRFGSDCAVRGLPMDCLRRISGFMPSSAEAFVAERWIVERRNSDDHVEVGNLIDFGDDSQDVADSMNPDLSLIDFGDEPEPAQLDLIDFDFFASPSPGQEEPVRSLSSHAPSSILNRCMVPRASRSLRLMLLCSLVATRAPPRRATSACRMPHGPRQGLWSAFARRCAKFSCRQENYDCQQSGRGFLGWSQRPSN